ncbi:MAG: redoxin domain-containing protein, partial [Spirochaetia bacterium]|nr:redoxin domain-containing protein [Spirochaetia bacterium]
KGILVFWHTWCYSCKDEIKLLKSVNLKEKGWKLWIINSGENLKEIQKYFNRKDFKFKSIIDTNSFIIESKKVPAVYISKGDGYIYGSLNLYHGDKILDGAMFLMNNPMGKYNFKEFLSFYKQVIKFCSNILMYDSSISILLLIFMFLIMAKNEIKNISFPLTILGIHISLKIIKTCLRFIHFNYDFSFPENINFGLHP